MSHTTKIGKTSFIHNGDPLEEGSIITIVAERTNGMGSEVPMDDLISFIGTIFQNEAIAEIEQTDPRLFLIDGNIKTIKEM